MNVTLSQIDAMRRTALREYDKRKYFYPKWVQAGKMSQTQADFELQAMQDIVNYFNWLQIHSPPEQQKLFKRF